MSNNLRGGTIVWNASAVGAGGTSGFATPGSSPNVVVMIKNTGVADTVITVQAGAASGAPGSGMNVDPTAIDWYDYDAGESGNNTIAVAQGTKKAFELSPFAAPFIRLSSSAATTLTALVISNG